MSANAQLKTYLDVAWRRKWWVFLPLVASGIAGMFLLRHLPKVYRASTTILVTPQRLPEDYVRSTVTLRVEDRMSSLSVQMLSRSFLETVSHEFGYAAKEASEREIEQSCSALRQRIELTPGRNLAYFEVAFEDGSPERAAGVANRLADLFIEQNSSMRTEQAVGTLSTVESWLEKKKIELDSLEARIASYKQGHVWELSDQLNANLQLLNAAQQRSAALSRDIQAKQDRVADLRAQAKLESTITGVASSTDGDPAARRLAALEAELAQLRVSYTDENPAVRRKRYEIEEFRKQHEELGTVASAPGQPAFSGPRRTELERVEREIASLEQERAATQAQIASLGTRINNTPLREQEYKNLARGYDSLKKEYEDLLQKREQATRAEELESSRKSEQFTIQDRARPPSLPHRPVPLQVILICLLAGLVAGVGLTVVLEFLDQSLKTEDDFRRAFPDLPLLSAVPRVAPEKSVPRVPRSRVAGGKHAAVALLLVAGSAAAWLGTAADWTTR